MHPHALFSLMSWIPWRQIEEDAVILGVLWTGLIYTIVLFLLLKFTVNLFCDALTL